MEESKFGGGKLLKQFTDFDSLISPRSIAVLMRRGILLHPSECLYNDNGSPLRATFDFPPIAFDEAAEIIFSCLNFFSSEIRVLSCQFHEGRAY
jgi:hypothetical protein